MIFEDYTTTGLLYHVIDINDLKIALKTGIRYDQKFTYVNKYFKFHQFIDLQKTPNIPSFVLREKAIFASMNFSENHHFHSHSVILGIRVNPNNCWIANENLANFIYEPLILSEIQEFQFVKDYINTVGVKKAIEYWNTSKSFIDNLSKRLDKKQGYDAEVLIFQDIPSKDIVPLYIVSDHKILTINEWKSLLRGTDKNENR